MNRTTCGLRAFAFLAGLAVLSGCQPTAVRTPRPVPGDCVTPTLYAAPPWTAGQQAILTAQLVARGPGRTDEFLRLEEVPDETELWADVTFYDGDQVIGEVAPVRLATSPC
jgi:hypothetical protein